MEADTKATKEEADVQPAEDAKTAADKAKSDAEAELAKAKEEAEKAKQKVEELKKDEADSLAGLKYALEKMEADAIEKINKDDKITDKDAAIDKAKAAIGKEDLLKAIENGEISASEAARDLDDQAATAEANKNQDPQADNIGATTPTIKDEKAGDKVSEADKKAFAEADKKAAAEEAARPESEKIQDKADQLLKEINYLTAIADKDKAAAEVLLEKFNHAEEVLLEARQAKRATEEANSNPEVLKALEKVVYNLELDRDTAKQELAKVVVPLEAYTEQINKLTDEYNQTLKDLEAVKAKEASTEKLDTPTTEETLAKEKAEADKAEKEYEKLLKAKEADKPKDVVTDKGEPAVQPENPVAETPVKPTDEKPAPAAETPAKPVEKSEAEKKVDALKGEIADLEAELAKDKDNEEISDKLNAMRSALARAEKDLKENPDALIYAVLLPKVDALPTASQALEAEINKLKEEKEKTTDDSQKAELEKKIAEQEALLNEVKEAEAKASKKLAAQKEFLENFDKALEQEVKELEEKAKENPEIKDQIQGFIDELKKQAAAKRADFEKRFEEGLTAEEADAEIEKDAQAEEEAEKKEAEELAAQKSFLAEFDQALEETVKELEKAETNSPEEAQAKAAIIKKLKEEAAAKRADFEKRFEEGLTAEEAKAEVDKFNNDSEKKEESKKVDTDAEIEALQNKVADLEKEVADLEKLVADNENNPAAVDYVTAAKEKLEAKKADLEEAKKELEKALDVLGPEGEDTEETPTEPAKPSEDAAIEALQNKVADLEKEVARLESDLKDAEENNVEDYVKEGLEKAITEKKAELEKAEAELEEALKGLEPSNGDALVQPELPEYTGPVTPPTGETPAPATPAHPMPAPAEIPAPTPATPAAEAPATAAPAVAGTSQDNTYQAPAAKADDKKELPNTGGKDNVAIASLGFLGLLLGALPFAKRKN
ncbi:pneumococcal surface protein PspA [Streptococcus pneumoniae]|nr:pneumococcal surface protein PspA [Streptococcus pneumoniae]